MNLVQRVERLEAMLGIDQEPEDEDDSDDPPATRNLELDRYRERTRKHVLGMSSTAEACAASGDAEAGERVIAYSNVLRYL